MAQVIFEGVMKIENELPGLLSNWNYFSGVRHNLVRELRKCSIVLSGLVIAARTENDPPWVKSNREYFEAKRRRLILEIKEHEKTIRGISEQVDKIRFP